MVYSRRRTAYRVLILFSILVVSVFIAASDVYGATRVSISGCKDISVGDTFTATIKFTGDDTARVEGQLGYDSAKLEYISGGSNTGNYGFVDLSKGGGNGSVTFKIKFKALAGGKTGLDVSSSEIYDYNKNPIDNCSISKVITIAGAGSKSNDVVDETTEAKDRIEITEETTTAATVETEPTEYTEEPSTIPLPEEENEPAGFDNRLLIAISAITLVIILIVAILLIRSRRRK